MAAHSLGGRRRGSAWLKLFFACAFFISEYCRAADSSYSESAAPTPGGRPSPDTPPELPHPFAHPGPPAGLPFHAQQPSLPAAAAAPPQLLSSSYDGSPYVSPLATQQPAAFPGGSAASAAMAAAATAAAAAGAGYPHAPVAPAAPSFPAAVHKPALPGMLGMGGLAPSHGASGPPALPPHLMGIFNSSTSSGSGSAGSSGSVGVPSASAMAANVDIFGNEQADSTLNKTVKDTSLPVGFYSSADGVYLSPRFPSTLQVVSEASEELIKGCIMRVSASQMTNGFSDTLKAGSVQVYGHSGLQLLRILSTSVPRYTSKLGAPYVFVQRLRGVRVNYDIKVGVPKGCVLMAGDPNLLVFVRTEASYIIEIQVRLYPDVLAAYLPSVAALPSDVLAAASALPPNSNFQSVGGHCVFAAHFSASPEAVRLLASYTQVKISVNTERGPESLQLQIPTHCLPQSLHRIAMWVAPVYTGSVVIVAFSPPAKTESDWFMLKSTGDEAAFQRIGRAHN